MDLGFGARCDCGACITHRMPPAFLAEALAEEILVAEVEHAEKYQLRLEPWRRPVEDTMMTVSEYAETGHIPMLTVAEMAAVSELVWVLVAMRVNRIARMGGRRWS